jgi:serine/threonine-protein kinase
MNDPHHGFPERVGRYEVLLPIASGGMATVYLARAHGARGFESEVALKLTHAHLRESAEFTSGLLEEAKLAVRIRHRNVVSVLDAGDDPHGIFLVMEYVEGDTLAGLRKRSAGGPPPTPVAARILVDALAGLHAAHELRGEDGQSLGVVHRDFTPHNILVGTDGVARLTDFGIAKAATRLSHTRTGNVKGKVAYMAPEQATGAQLDRRCDVWAAGVMAWEMFAGRHLHAKDEDFATMLRVVTERPPRLSTIDPSIHPDVDDVVASALEMTAAERCPTAALFSRMLASACRAHGGVAEAEEVAEWVARASGAKLAARRAQVIEVRALRAKVGRIVDVAVDQRPSTPSSRGVELPARNEARVRTAEGPGWAQLAPTVEVDRAQPTTTPTGLASVHQLRRGVSLGPRTLGIAATGAALVFVVLLGTWRAAAPRDDARASDPPPTAVPSSASSPASQDPAPVTAPAPQPVGATAPALVAAPSATPPPRIRSVVVPAAPPHPPAAPSSHPRGSPAVPGPLAPSPY